MKNNKKNINNKESRFSQLNPESKLLPAELATAVGGVALPTESISLNFTKIEYRY
ncbi:hypothetical protein H6G36_20035 [Anabaena minutissima FACHB-250]|nr:hypothetical protein [Anabaena minutissima FACHB-250]